MLKALQGQAEEQPTSPLTSTSLNPGNSDDLEALLSDSDLAHMAAEFKATMDQTGMSGVSALVDDCYKSISALGGDGARKRAAYCVTLDLVGLDFDTSFRRAFEAQTQKAPPPAPYYEEGVWKARMASRLPLTTVRRVMPDTAIFRTYANAADKKLADLVGG